MEISSLTWAVILILAIFFVLFSDNGSTPKNDENDKEKDNNKNG